jgi:hypothetical protein
MHAGLVWEGHHERLGDPDWILEYPQTASLKSKKEDSITSKYIWKKKIIIKKK